MHTKCAMLPAATMDTSTLVSLAKISSLDLIGKLVRKAMCPQAVYHESVTDGLTQGYEDAVFIQRLFAEKLIRVVPHTAKQEMGLSLTDSIVLSLAKQAKSVLLANDTKLARRGAACGLVVLGSPDLLLLAKRERMMRASVYREKIQALYREGRLSQSNMQFYLEVVA